MIFHKKCEINCWNIIRIFFSTLECTEASQTFSDKPLEGSKIYSDLYSLTLDTAKPEVLEQMKKAKAVFLNSVYEFLSFTKVLSYAWNVFPLFVKLVDILLSEQINPKKINK